ncbi:hypothetical protein GF402_02815 [Candidatus Fermentibacteria bacterium]|nr:hypothetical protein [Candidatus Fermentibacteria bacterium]
MRYEPELYSESYVAAKSLKNAWTRMASTYGCIRVALTDRHLVVEPQGLGGLLVKMSNLDLEHRIPVGEVTSVEKRRKYFGLTEVQVAFGSSDGSPGRLLLYLRRPDEFIARLKPMAGIR